MARLNQIIAVVNGKKTQSQKALKDIYHKIQKGDLFSGIARTYRPKDEDGDKLPSESKQVQFRVADALQGVAATLTDLFDVIGTQELANTVALANISVDGKVILEGVPVTYMLFLEKQLVDIHTFIDTLPVLDPGQEWSFSDGQNCYATKSVETTRTKKIPRNHVVAEATEKHPAQVQVFHEDVVAGYWSTITYSGAIPQREKSLLIERVRKLQEAVKFAREQANSVEVTNVSAGSPVFAYLFGKE